MKINFRSLLIYIILFPGVLSACSDRHSQYIPVKEAKSPAVGIQGEESAEQTQLEYGDIWTQEKSEYVIIPVGYKVKSKKRGIDYSAESYSSSRSSILKGQDLSAVNLIFHGHKNDRTHLLLDRNAFITKFDYLVDSQTTADKIESNITASSCKPPANTPADHSFHQLMVYQIVDRDTNQNQALDPGDANKGYLSDLTGKNLRSLTPNSTKLTQWHCDYQRNQLLLFVREANHSLNKGEINPLALYIYDLPTSKLTRLSLPKSNLENWQIDLKDGSMYLYSRLDGNSDRQYDSADETRVIKYNLDSKQTVEINSPQIRELLTQ